MARSSWKLHHVGIPVKDLDKSLAAYKSLGIASFQPEFLIDSSLIEEYLVYGKTPDPVVKTRGAMGNIGPLGIELLQPVSGNTVHKELLDSTGEGIGHIAYTVENLEQEAAEMVAQGIPIILSIRHKGQTTPGAIYFDTRNKLSKLIIELIQAH